MRFTQNDLFRCYVVPTYCLQTYMLNHWLEHPSSITYIKAIKEYAMAYQDTKYLVATILDSMEAYINVRQHNDKNLIDYLKRYRVARDMFYSHVGVELLLPKLALKIKEQINLPVSPRSSIVSHSDIAVEGDGGFVVKSLVTHPQYNQTVTGWQGGIVMIALITNVLKFHFPSKILCLYMAHFFKKHMASQDTLSVQGNGPAQAIETHEQEKFWWRRCVELKRVVKCWQRTRAKTTTLVVKHALRRM